MHTIVVGLNHKTAPVELREKLVFREEELPAALTRFKEKKSILECVILSTCNRTELYAVADQLHTGPHFMKAFLGEWFGLEPGSIADFLYIKTGDDAVRHLFLVSCGLDSMVVGETQILGQVRDAWQIAQQAGTSGKIFNTLFKQAITLAKKAHTETGISQNAVSISYAAVELGKKIFGHFEQKNVLIIGAGEMGELTAKHLFDLGASSVMVVNRTLERAEALAAKFRGTAYGLDKLEQCLIQADIVISSTGAEGFILTKADVEKALKFRKGRPLFMIDIAVPRDLDPEINGLETVYLYDIDDLEGVVEANLQEREKEARKISLWIEEEVQEFRNWFGTLEMIPVIDALRRKALKIQEETMKSIERKIPDLDERELKVLRKHTKSIVNQLLKDPILQLKEMSGHPDSKKALELMIKIFALEEYLAQAEKAGEAEEAAVKEPERDWGTVIAHLPARS